MQRQLQDSKEKPVKEYEVKLIDEIKTECKFKKCVWEKINYYLTYDNPFPGDWVESLAGFFSTHGAKARASALQFKVDNRDNFGQDFILTTYDFILDGESNDDAGKTLRRRMGEGLCNAYGISEAQLAYERSQFFCSMMAGPMGGGPIIPHHIVEMYAIKKYLEPHINELRKQKSRLHNDL